MPLPRSVASASHRDIDLRLVAGEWPDGLSGEVVISAPAADPAIPSVLFGHGVMIRLSLRPGTFGAADDRWAWRARTIDTPTRRLHERCPDAFGAGSLGYESPFGAPNMVNTAPLPWGDRLFATWDVGRPTEIDPVGLGFLGEVGHKASWGGDTIPSPRPQPFLFSSAHPVVDPDRGCLWTVKLVPGSFSPWRWQPWVVRYDGEGTEVRAWPVRGALLAGSMHTITQTRDWLVLADSGNFKADPDEMAGGPRTVTIDDEAPVFLVRKDALDGLAPGAEVDARTFTVAPTTGHYYAVHDDADGVRIIFEHMDLVDLAIQLRADDTDALGRPIDPSQVGVYNMGMGPSTVSEVVLDPVTGGQRTEAVVREDWMWNHQLSAMDWSLEGMRSPTLHHVVYQGFRPGNISQRALRLYGDRVDRSGFPGEETPGSLISLERGTLEVTARHEFRSTEDLPSSPVFVPRGAGATGTGGTARSRYAGTDPGGHDGWVVCPVLSDSGLRVEVFDAADVGRGAVAVLAADGGEQVPLLLHSAWMPRAVEPAPVERLRFSDELDAAAIACLDEELGAAARAVADELDDAVARRSTPG